MIYINSIWNEDRTNTYQNFWSIHLFLSGKKCFKGKEEISQKVIFLLSFKDYRKTTDSWNSQKKVMFMAMIKIFHVIVYMCSIPFKRNLLNLFYFTINILLLCVLLFNKFWIVSTDWFYENICNLTVMLYFNTEREYF